MKKIYPLFLLATMIVSSRKKDEATTLSNNDESKLSSSRYYEIGTVLPSPDSNLVTISSGAKISYLARVPYVYSNCGDCNGSQLASGSYNKLMTEVARSRNGLYSVFYQLDGNLVLYRRISANGDLGAALWATNQYEASPLPSDQWGSYPWALTVFQGDGNILCKTTSGSIYWASNIITSSTNAIWILQDDGNFVGYSSWTVNSSGAVIITGSAFAATGTDGGKSSKFFGRMGKAG